VLLGWGDGALKKASARYLLSFGEPTADTGLTAGARGIVANVVFGVVAATV
jgi:hypothetical protein